jgi:23S rRNA pseudouridine1911/1915/1917 synthase
LEAQHELQALKRERLDRLIARSIPEMSRSRAKALIEAGHVRVNAVVRVSASTKLQAGQSIHVVVPPLEQLSLIPEDLNLDIVFEDDDLLVVNKRAGMVVHPSKGHDSGTLVHGLLHCITDLSGIGGTERPGIVHRLDKGTSGVMVVAKSDVAHQGLKDQFFDHSITREYWALVLGTPDLNAGQVEGWLGRKENDRMRFATVAEGEGRWARTHWKVVQRLHRSSLLACRLETGRTHQVRVHMASKNWPLLGDPMYRNRQTMPPTIQRLLQDVDHQLLHARLLAFDHPRTGERLSFECPVPADFQQVLEGLRAHQT